jgi:chromatin remodeling complex protein RSC6
MDAMLIETIDVEAQFDLLQQNLTKFKTTISDMQQQLRGLEKYVKKEIKDNKKKEVSKPPPMRQPKMIGFDIPEKITPELCAFMQLPSESKSTRNTVTTFMTEYIRQHKLQDMTDRKLIHLNTDLAALFKLTATDHVTYFNLHKHISALFIR